MMRHSHTDSCNFLEINSDNSHNGMVSADAGDRINDSKSIFGSVVLSFIFLALAHLAVKAFFPNPAVWLVGLLSIMGIGTFWLTWKNDDFEILLALFVCFHFPFADQQGSVWAYLVFALFIIRLVTGRNHELSMGSIPFILSLCAIIFLFFQLIGSILNPYSFVSNIQAFIIACSHIFLFYWAASQKLSLTNTRRFLSVWFLLVFWLFMINLNQKFHWISTESPLLFHYGRIAELARSTPVGSFQNSELNAEYFCFVFLFSFILILFSDSAKKIRLNRIRYISGLLISIVALMWGGSRAAIILALFGLSYIVVFDFIIIPSFSGFRRLAVFIALIPFLCLLLYVMSVTSSLDSMIEDFKQTDTAGLNVENVISGQGINRGALFDMAMAELSKKSRWIGPGYNINENNRKSLGIEKKAMADYHSLYLSLPFFYGWIGSLAYLLIVIGTLLRIYLLYIYMRAKRTDHLLSALALGFSLMWMVFLIDQYKISVTRNPSYFMLTWFFLGMTHAVANTIRDETNHLEC